MQQTPQWTVGVVTREATCAEYRSVKNSLLYADKTEWISIETLRPTMGMIGVRLNKAAIQLGLQPAEKFESEAERNRADLKTHASFAEDIKRFASDAGVTVHLSAEQASENLTKWWSYHMRLIQDHADDEKLRTSGQSLLLFVDQTIEGATKEVRAVVDGRRRFCQYCAATAGWKSAQAAQELMSSLSRILLPDVSDLPVEGILETRLKLRDLLDPVRAEMLHLTDDLRKVAEGKPEQLAAEADNLIATKVEPVVRSATVRVNKNETHGVKV